MTATAFDTHKAAKTLTKAGLTNEQADAHVEVLMEVTEGIATKADIKDLKHKIELLGSTITGKMWQLQMGTVIFVLGGVFTMLKFM